jgi:hypothetical protein
MRVAGCALLTASIVPTVAAQPGATGYVAWFGLVTAAGLLLIFVLPYAPRMAARLAIGAPVAAGLAVLLRAVS